MTVPTQLFHDAFAQWHDGADEAFWFVDGFHASGGDEHPRRRRRRGLGSLRGKFHGERQ
jgi:hypothetical protein